MNCALVAAFQAPYTWWHVFMIVCFQCWMADLLVLVHVRGPDSMLVPQAALPLVAPHPNDEESRVENKHDEHEYRSRPAHPESALQTTRWPSLLKTLALEHTSVSATTSNTVLSKTQKSVKW